jgi:galactokinase
MLGVPNLRPVSEPSAVERLPSPLKERARHVVTENARVQAAINADATEFGVLMSTSHASLRDDYAVSLPAIDELVAALQRPPGCFVHASPEPGSAGAASRSLPLATPLQSAATSPHKSLLN